MNSYTLRDWVKLSCSLALTASAIFAGAQAPGANPPTALTTWAWRQTIPGDGSNAPASGGMDVDAQGYAYAFYCSGPLSTRMAHLRKVGPANAFQWDNVLDLFTNYFFPFQVVVSPKISGSQYIYVVGTIDGPPISPGVINTSSIWIRKLDTSGTNVWAGSLLFGNGYNNNLAGVYADTNGHLYVAANQADNSGAGIGTCFYDVAPDGSYSVVSTPDLNAVGHGNANYDPGTSSWFVTGSQPGAAPTGVWGSYNRTTGSKNFGGYTTGIQGDNFSTPTTEYVYHVDLLPANHFALVRNKEVIYPFNFITMTVPTPDYNHHVQVLSTNNTLVFDYPSSGSDPAGITNQVISSSPSNPIYTAGQNASGTPGYPLQYLEAFTWAGNLQLHRDQAPVQTLFPSADGFYDLFDWSGSGSYTFLEHYLDSATNFFWGRAYAQQAGDSSQYLTEFKQFQNCFYTLRPDSLNISLDRFVSGVTLNNLSASSTFATGSPLSVMINLNAPVATGQTVTVSLYSNNANVTMPNGQRSQAFTLTAGQSGLAVPLNTAFTGSPYNVVVQGLQNGVYRYVASSGS